MELFLDLFNKFETGLKFIRSQFRDGKDNPFFRKELAQFQRTVVQPMDEAWERCSKLEKRRFIETNHTMLMDWKGN